MWWRARLRIGGVIGIVGDNKTISELDQRTDDVRDLRKMYFVIALVNLGQKKTLYLNVCKRQPGEPSTIALLLGIIQCQWLLQRRVRYYQCTRRQYRKCRHHPLRLPTKYVDLGSNRPWRMYTFEPT